MYWVWEAEWVRVSEWGTANEPVTENYPYCSHARNKRRRLARGWTVIKKIHHSLTARYQRSRHLTPPTPYPSSFSPVVGDIFMTSNCSLSSSRCTLFLPLIHVKSDLCTWNSRVCFGLGCVPLPVFFRFLSVVIFYLLYIFLFYLVISSFLVLILVLCLLLLMTTAASRVCPRSCSHALPPRRQVVVACVGWLCVCFCLLVRAAGHYTPPL